MLLSMIIISFSSDTNISLHDLCIFKQNHLLGFTSKLLHNHLKILKILQTNEKRLRPLYHKKKQRCFVRSSFLYDMIKIFLCPVNSLYVITLFPLSILFPYKNIKTLAVSCSILYPNPLRTRILFIYQRILLMILKNI